jgi:hypothetical protein
MFTARTVVEIVAPGARGIAASSVSGIDNASSVPSGAIATAAVVRPALADEPTLSIKPASAATVHAVRSPVTAQK